MSNSTVGASSARSTIMDACQSISRSADALKDCHTVDGDWGDDLDAKEIYDGELRLLERLTAMLDNPGQPEPINMLLFCPKCGEQHIDAPEVEPGRLISSGPYAGRAVPPKTTWSNPPHCSHLCHACGTIWRPADVPTNGVATIHTRGKSDTWDRQSEPFTVASALEWAGIPDACRKDIEPRAEVTEEQPSLTNPLTPYGMLVRALRIVAQTSLYDMGQALLLSPAKLSAMEFGREPVTPEIVREVGTYFESLGIHNMRPALQFAIDAARAGDAS